jgi:phage tail tape-measure protein
MLAIARASRNKTECGKEKLKQAYVVQAAGRVVGQAQRFSQEIAASGKRATASYREKQSSNWTR